MHWVDITNEELLLKSSIKDVLTLTDTSGIHHVSVSRIFGLYVL